MLQIIREKTRSLVTVASFSLLDVSQVFSRVAVAFRYGFQASPLTRQSEAIQNFTRNDDVASKQISFTFALISLSAQVARADGSVTKAEYLAFRDAFPLNGGMCGKIRQLFALACQNPTPFSQHISQIKTLFPEQKELFIALVDRLFHIATADKPLTTAKERLLSKISHHLGLNPAEYSAIYDKYSRPLPPHAVLGVKKRSPKTIVKQRYYALMKKYHPDCFTGSPISSEVQQILTLKTTEISQAYSKLTKAA